MAVQIRQSTRMGWYLMRQRLEKRERFPLIVELEPLFQCNLACSGCGKIQHPEHELRRRMPVEQARRLRSRSPARRWSRSPAASR